MKLFHCSTNMQGAYSATGFSLLLTQLSSHTLDQVVTMLLTSGISALVAIAKVGKDGNASTGWLPIWGQVHKYCYHVSGTLGASFSRLVLYVMILLCSIHTVLHPLLVWGILPQQRTLDSVFEVWRIFASPSISDHLSRQSRSLDLQGTLSNINQCVIHICFSVYSWLNEYDHQFRYFSYQEATAASGDSEKLN